MRRPRRWSRPPPRPAGCRDPDADPRRPRRFLSQPPPTARPRISLTWTPSLRSTPCSRCRPAKTWATGRAPAAAKCGRLQIVTSIAPPGPPRLSRTCCSRSFPALLCDGRQWPACLARSRPSRKASITSSYLVSEKISVTLTLMPSARQAAMAGSPCRAAGIVTNRLGRSTRHHSARASAMVSLGVVGQPRVHLDRHPPVHAVRGAEDGPQYVAGPAHIVGGQRAQRLLDAGAARPQVVQLPGVLVTAGDRLGEDGRIWWSLPPRGRGRPGWPGCRSPAVGGSGHLARSRCPSCLGQ